MNLGQIVLIQKKQSEEELLGENDNKQQDEGSQSAEVHSSQRPVRSTRGTSKRSQDYVYDNNGTKGNSQQPLSKTSANKDKKRNENKNEKGDETKKKDVANEKNKDRKSKENSDNLKAKISKNKAKNGDELEASKVKQVAESLKDKQKKINFSILTKIREDREVCSINWLLHRLLLQLI